jgi:hypothetical protein
MWGMYYIQKPEASPVRGKVLDLGVHVLPLDFGLEFLTQRVGDHRLTSYHLGREHQTASSITEAFCSREQAEYKPLLEAAIRPGISW